MYDLSHSHHLNDDELITKGLKLMINKIILPLFK